MKIIVAHEGKQHSFRTAEALYQKGYLFKYITTVYDRPHSLTNILKRFLKGNAQKKCASRKTEAFPNEYVIQFDEWKELLLLFMYKVPFLKRFSLVFWDKLHDSFGKKVALFAIKNNVDAVIMYDSMCNKCWQILKEKAPHIKRIMDVSIANRLFMKENFIHDMEQTGDKEIMNEQSDLWIPYFINRYLEEIQLSNYFLVASNMVKRSMMFSGITENQIFMAPYGVDSQKFNYIPKHEIDKPLKLIYVGQISYRKGIHHLLKVIRTFPENSIEIFLAGDYNEKNPLFLQYKEYNNIHFLGFITRDILSQYYQKADVFVFPTIGEGYGLVILEALSCGLPCIVSDLAGGNDAIINGYNGFEFKAGDDNDLKQKIQWFLDHPNSLPQLSKNSRESIQKQTWNLYFENVAHAIEKICHN